MGPTKQLAELQDRLTAMIFGSSPMFVEALTRLLAEHSCDATAAPAGACKVDHPVGRVVVADRGAPFSRIDELFASAAAFSIPIVVVSDARARWPSAPHRNITWDASPRELLAAIRAASEGGPSSAWRENSGDGALTDRELDVLRLVAAGYSSSVVAERLQISPHTVRTHAQSAMTKLGVRSRLAAVAIARRHGLLTPGRGDVRSHR